MTKKKAHHEEAVLETGGDTDIEVVGDVVQPIPAEAVPVPEVERPPVPEKLRLELEEEQAAGRAALERLQKRDEQFPRETRERHPLEGENTEVLRPDDPRLDRLRTSIIGDKHRPATDEGGGNIVG